MNKLVLFRDGLRRTDDRDAVRRCNEICHQNVLNSNVILPSPLPFVVMYFTSTVELNDTENVIPVGLPVLPPCITK